MWKNLGSLFNVPIILSNRCYKIFQKQKTDTVLLCFEKWNFVLALKLQTEVKRCKNIGFHSYHISLKNIVLKMRKFKYFNVDVALSLTLYLRETKFLCVRHISNTSRETLTNTSRETCIDVITTHMPPWTGLESYFMKVTCYRSFFWNLLSFFFQ